jgi:hypothetical protein
MATGTIKLMTNPVFDRSTDVETASYTKTDELKLLVKDGIAYIYVKTKTGVSGFVQLAQLPSDLYAPFYRVPGTVFIDSTSDASKNVVGVITDEGRVYIRTSSSTSGVVHLMFVYPLGT